MGSYTNKFINKGLLHPPLFVSDNIHYECMMGSVAYGVSDENSDIDIYGFCIPPKHLIFPHLAGSIPGFGRQIQRFNQFQGKVKETDQNEYDFSIYSIVRYFQLCMENNPNMIDSLFVPYDCVLFSTQVGELVRENRNLFLHKGAWFRFKGYSYSQLHKITNKDKIGKRKSVVEQYGFDVKSAYHLVRLMNEIEMILSEGTLDLRRNREQLKDIRRGNWTENQVRQYFDAKEIELEKLYLNSTLPYGPDENKIKELLLNCLEIHYGNLDNCVNRGINLEAELLEIENTVGRIRKSIINT